MCCHATLLEAWQGRRGGMHKHMRWSVEKGAQWRALDADPRGLIVESGLNGIMHNKVDFMQWGRATVSM